MDSNTGISRGIRAKRPLDLDMIIMEQISKAYIQMAWKKYMRGGK